MRSLFQPNGWKGNISNMITGKVLFITGGTGSLGQEIVAQALNLNPQAIRIFSRGEHSQMLMRARFKDERLRFIIGDIRDYSRLYAVTEGADYLIHTAALKQVETCEYNPQEVLQTNIVGSINVVNVARERKIKHVLGISSDKAVAPLNLYGATKLAMERMFIEANRWAMPVTAFAILRSGNFLTSRGNVMEIWGYQAQIGKPLTVTSERMRRYFIETDKVAKLTLDLVVNMEAGCVYVPKMQEFRVTELLKRHFPDSKIKILHSKSKSNKFREELFAHEEHPEDNGDYWVIR